MKKGSQALGHSPRDRKKDYFESRRESDIAVEISKKKQPVKRIVKEWKDDKPITEEEGRALK